MKREIRLERLKKKIEVLQDEHDELDYEINREQMLPDEQYMEASQPEDVNSARSTRGAMLNE